MKREKKKKKEKKTEKKHPLTLNEKTREIIIHRIVRTRP